MHFLVRIPLDFFEKSLFYGTFSSPSGIPCRATPKGGATAGAKGGQGLARSSLAPRRWLGSASARLAFGLVGFGLAFGFGFVLVGFGLDLL